MGGTQKYLCRKVQEGEIENDDLLESQAKLTLLKQAPQLVLDAVARGWLKYPDKIEGLDDDEDVSRWIGLYDCERAYRKRQEGLTYREIGKLMGCGIAREMFFNVPLEAIQKIYFSKSNLSVEDLLEVIVPIYGGPGE